MRAATRYWLISVTMLIFAGLATAQEAKQDTLRELMRRIDILTEELEKSKLGEVAERRYESKFGLGPAASQVYYKKDAGVSIAGYGEVVYENFATNRDDDVPSSRTDRIDYLRNIIYVGYKFNERFLFNAEIEFEHGKTGEGSPGAVSMEFGYVDAMLSPLVTLRAGMVLVPVGIVNEYHEPATFYGSLRPESERQIIPSTWRTTGAGLAGGTEGGLGYRVFIIEGLDGSKFSSGGIRSGRQNGAQAIAENLAFTGRLEYTGVPGLNLGASFYTGNSGQGMLSLAGNKIDVRTTIVAAHGIFSRSGLELRGLYARSFISDVAELNGVRGFSGAASIGEEQYGYYLTAAYDVLPFFKQGSGASLMPFIQYERLNTQDKVPAGFAANPANDRTNVTFGLMFKPIPNIGFKADYMDRKNEAGTGLNQFNLAVAYYF